MKLDRSKNLQLKQYNVAKNHDIFGAPWKTYSSTESDQRDALDALWPDSHRPYLVQVTCLIESPMKLFVMNQNYTKVLLPVEFDEDAMVTNVVKFEAELRWFDFFNLLPVENKKQIGEWRISDFNFTLNENPLFEGEEY